MAMIEVFFADEQSDLPVPGGRLRELAEYVLTSEGVTERAEVCLLMIDAVSMSNLNERFLARKGPTDVLAFPVDELPWEADEEADDMPVMLGDVVVCPAVAEVNAARRAGAYEEELALLVVHGLLHLLGHDHATDADAAAMERLERDLLAGFGATKAADTAEGPGAEVGAETPGPGDEPGDAAGNPDGPGGSRPRRTP